ncbi:YihY/virulence factor BrkB family protein [Mumia flava]|uniref:YihY/virulence factor BrkB family protein n=1 Tax=Mumia flava TaxID=1348852 RepID=UPI001FED05E6|nr:YihY/virulence factor BrkB family protein [Mumia flava]
MAIAAVGLACAVLTRRRLPARRHLSVAATTILSLIGALVAGAVALALLDDPVQVPVALVASAGAALGLVQVGAWTNRTARERARAFGWIDGEGPTMPERVETFAERHPWWVGPYQLPLLLVRVWRRTVDVRITGLAAEMTYYALISLVPLVTALGAALGYLERVVGADAVATIEEQAIDAVTNVFAEQVTTDVMAPMIEDLLHEERAGVAIGSVAVAIWLASRMFRAAIRALDDTYEVEERRGLPEQWLLGVALAIGAVITIAVVLAMVVVGPLLGGGKPIADSFGLGTTFEILWELLRWPLVGAVSVSFLVILYRYGPNVRNTWQGCVPGAIVGTVGVVLVAFGFQLYLGWAGPGGPARPDIQEGSLAVLVAGQVVGAILAGVIWLWLSATATLVGGVVNAELGRMRREAERSRRRR